MKRTFNPNSPGVGGLFFGALLLAVIAYNCESEGNIIFFYTASLFMFVLCIGAGYSRKEDF